MNNYLSENQLSDLLYYLTEFEKILYKIPLEQKIYKEGITAGQIFYHTTQVVNFWFLVYAMDKTYERDRKSEFTKQPTLKQIKTSLNFAIDLCRKLPSYRISLDKKLKKTITVEPSNFIVEDILGVLIHISIHTGEHWGELHLLVDK